MRNWKIMTVSVISKDISRSDALTICYTNITVYFPLNVFSVAVFYLPATHYYYYYY